VHFIKNGLEKHRLTFFVLIQLSENMRHEFSVVQEMSLLDGKPQISLHFCEMELKTAGKDFWVALARHHATLHHCLHHVFHISTTQAAALIAVVDRLDVVVELEGVRAAETCDEVSSCYTLHFLYLFRILLSLGNCMAVDTRI
jgi:hypothetical protein